MDHGNKAASLAEAATLGDDDDEGGHEGNRERCPTCQRPLDDEFDAMTEQQLLEHLQHEQLADLARGFRNGTITHQEKAIIRGMLRDNRVTAPKDETPEDEAAVEPDDDVRTAGRPTPMPPVNLEGDGG